MDISFNNPAISGYFDGSTETPPLEEFHYAYTRPLEPGNFITAIKKKAQNLTYQKDTLVNIGPNMKACFEHAMTLLITENREYMQAKLSNSDQELIEEKTIKLLKTIRWLDCLLEEMDEKRVK